jgi:hypothetical protein
VGCPHWSPVADGNDISTTYFFVRQLGNTFGVTAATVMFDRRMTLHSSRLLDVPIVWTPPLARPSRNIPI